MSVFDDYKNIRTEVEAKIKAARELAREAFTVGVTDLFTRYPDLQELYWTQYTPYFNDGDECIFSVHDLYVNGWESWGYQDRDEFDNGQDFLEYKKPTKQMQSDAQEFRDIFSEDDLRWLFEDHVEVRVYRDFEGNIKTEVNEYQHD